MESCHTDTLRLNDKLQNKDFPYISQITIVTLEEKLKQIKRLDLYEPSNAYATLSLSFVLGNGAEDIIVYVILPIIVYRTSAHCPYTNF